MKSLLHSVLLFSVLASSVSFANPAVTPAYEVTMFEGQPVVLISQALAESIDHVTKSDATNDEKNAAIKALIAKESALVPGDENTFCAVAGKTYATINKNAEKMAAQCEDRLSDPDFGDTVEIEKDVNELRKKYSLVLLLMITFSF